jgi:hypothetical protein
MTEEMTKEEATQAFRQAIASCMLFYQTHKSFKDNANELQTLQNEANKLEQILETIWGSLCKIYAVANNWTASISHPGYLERKINDYKILVPKPTIARKLCHLVARSSNKICLLPPHLFLSL